MENYYSVELEKIGEHEFKQTIVLNPSFQMLSEDKVNRIYDLIEACTLEIEEIKNESEVVEYVN